MLPNDVSLKAVLACVLVLASSSWAKVPETPQIPLFFVKDTASASFILQCRGMLVRFLPGKVVYSSRAKQISINYLSENRVPAAGSSTQHGQINDFSGSDATRWTRNRAAFSEILYREMWPGIDVGYSTVSGNPKSEFRIQAGAQPSWVQWRVEGSDAVKISADGSLVLSFGDQEIRESPPLIYQLDRTTGKRTEIQGGFLLLKPDVVGIWVGDYDLRSELIFDPTIASSTYIGGSQQTVTTGMALDSTGNIVIAGYTFPIDIAPGTVIGTPRGISAFVAKLNPTGDQLVFCTYLGGSLDNRALAVSLDRWNNIYVAGSTTSSDFPTLKALQSSLSGAQDAFLTELSPEGSALVFSTYWGGTGAEQGTGVAVTRQGLIYLTGNTQSPDFPVRNAFQPNLGGGQDSFVVTFGIGGSTLIASSFLGGAADENSTGITIDHDGNPVIVGSTLSSNFPVVNPIQSATGGGQDAFVAKARSFGKGLLFSTYFGGSGGAAGLPETANGVAVDGAGSLYVTGTTSSSDFPVTLGVIQTELNGLLDAFVLKISPSGSLVYSTLLGGSSLDYGTAISVDAAANAHVAGYTSSSDFPTVRSLQSTLAGSYDSFVAEVNPAGTKLLNSTLLGGSGSDSATAVAVDRYGTVFLAGQTHSSDFPVVHAYQGTLQGQANSFVSRIIAGWIPAYYTSSGGWAADSLLNLTGTPGVTSSFGAPGDIPVVGDWTGAGHQYLGVFRNGMWFLDIDGDGVYTTADRSFLFGLPGDIPVAGDWTGSGFIQAGLYRNGTFILDLSGHLSGIPTGLSDATFPFGLASDIPVAGDWNGTGTTKVGVFRNGQWLLDSNGSHTVNGPVQIFGSAGDIPLVGNWDGSNAVRPGVYRGGNYLLDYNGDWTLSLANGDVAISFGPASLYGLVAH